MSYEKDGGPAFPCAEMSINSGTGEVETHQWSSVGVTMRDYFAAKAMQALITSQWSWRDLGLTPIGGLSDTEQLARFAHVYADAMLKARE